MPSGKSGSSRRAAEFDAVTVDAFGTLVELSDPTQRLRAALAAHGVVREPDAIAAAFAAEVEYYVPRSHEGRDGESLARLRRDSAAVFLTAVAARIDPEAFAPAFVEALPFQLVPGAREALRLLRAGGLTLSCVANWDVALRSQLDRLGVAGWFSAVVTSADAGAPKPDPPVFLLALAATGIAAERTLHVGDGEVDREGARAVGLAFEPPPLATLPARLGMA